MKYDSRVRDRYRLAVRATTAAVAATAMTATGWLAGAAAHDQATTTNTGHAQGTTAISGERPPKSRIATQYVTGATSSTSVGQGGTVSTPSPTPPPTAAPTTSAPAPVSTYVPPPPPPPPAPSNGS